MVRVAADHRVADVALRHAAQRWVQHGVLHVLAIEVHQLLGALAMDQLHVDQLAQLAYLAGLGQPLAGANLVGVGFGVAEPHKTLEVLGRARIADQLFQLCRVLRRQFCALVQLVRHLGGCQRKALGVGAHGRGQVQYLAGAALALVLHAGQRLAGGDALGNVLVGRACDAAHNVL